MTEDLSTTDLLECLDQGTKASRNWVQGAQLHPPTSYSSLPQEPGAVMLSSEKAKGTLGPHATDHPSILMEATHHVK